MTHASLAGLRKSAQILIFIDIPKALSAGLKFFLSDNGVVLTEGDASGFLKPEFFARVEDVRRQPIPGWEGAGPIDSKAVEFNPPNGSDSKKQRPPRRNKGKERRDKPVEEALEALSVQEGETGMSEGATESKE